MTKYIAYYRTSTKRQNLGLEAQAEAVHNFIKAEADAELIAEYQEQESGKNDARPELEKALYACKRENAVLLLAKLDRLSRKVSFIFALRENSIKFRALDMPMVNDVLTLAIYSGLAEQERLLISKRTKAALAAKKAQGYSLGNPRIFTTAEIEKATTTIKRKAQTNTNNIQSLSAIRQLQKEGWSNFSQIARYLNEHGYKTSRGGTHSAESVKRLIARDN
ncbi:MAG: recombinase family protein [Bacteroidaceae bacterium]|nr:recombinase family protein [Bacteroidaceae bacterium]